MAFLNSYFTHVNIIISQFYYYGLTIKIILSFTIYLNLHIFQAHKSHTLVLNRKFFFQSNNRSLEDKNVSGQENAVLSDIPTLDLISSMCWEES
jgi:hypothetical protein